MSVCRFSLMVNEIIVILFPWLGLHKVLKTSPSWLPTDVSPKQQLQLEFSQQRGKGCALLKYRNHMFYITAH